jgi:glycosyltransferase involved in cell wall biosynthesis
MLVRVFSPKWPFPVREGAHLIIAEHLKALIHQGHEVQFWCWDSRVPVDPCPIPNIEVVKIGKPQAAGAGWLQVVKKVRALPRLSSGEVAHYPEEVLDHVLRSKALRTVDKTVFHFSFSYAWLSKASKELLATKEIEVVFHNFESLIYFGKAIRARSRFRSIFDRYNSYLLDKHEKWLLKSGLVTKGIFLSATEAEAAKKTANPALEIIHELPSFLNACRLRQPFENRCNVIFVGAFCFWPNLESLQWLQKEVFPIIAEEWNDKIPGKILIIGTGITASMKAELRKFNFVSPLGFVEDLEMVFDNAGLCIAPEVGGSGFRVKVLEALQKGLPVLTHNETLLRMGTYKVQQGLILNSDSPAVWASLILKALRGARS